MHRMRLFTSGVKLPNLGSLKDVAMRKFLIHEEDLQLERDRLQMMTAMIGGVALSSQAARQGWGESVSRTWDTIRKKTYFQKITEVERQDASNLDFYMNVVRFIRPQAVQQKDGSRVISGFERVEKLYQS